MPEEINRPQLKQEMKELLRGAEVNPKAFLLLYLSLDLVLKLISSFVAPSAAFPAFSSPLQLFIRVLVGLLSSVLSIGFILYCMTVRRRQRAEFTTLFDGFSFAGRVIGLVIIELFFVFLWMLLFIIPGFIAAYRYRFAYYNLCENPTLGAMEALELSKRQTMGYKAQLFTFDLSYLGWGILAGLPTYITTSSASYAATQEFIANSGYTSAVSTPSLLVTVLCNLWTIAVALFYMPVMQCTELSYYEIAKRTSGVSPVPMDPPPLDSGSNGSDLF